MTTPEQRGPVDALYQRVESARHAYRVAVDDAHGHEDPPLRDALDALREATGDKGASADSVVQAVARALVDEGFDPESLDGVFAVAAAMVLRHEIAELRGHCDLIEGKSNVHPHPHPEWIKGVRSAADWLQLMVNQIERDDDQGSETRTVTYTEWCTYWGEDPNACDEGQQRRFPDLGLIVHGDREQAESMRRVAESGGIAQRQVTVYRTPWVVDTEVGEPR